VEMIRDFLGSMMLVSGVEQHLSISSFSGQNGRWGLDFCHNADQAL